MQMFHYFPTPKQDTPESLSGKQNIRKKIPGCKTHQMQAALVNTEIRWKMTQDPSWEHSHPFSWGEPKGETQWSIWVPSDTAELETYVGYSVSCSTWEAKFIYLFKEISAHH